jgi:hypothetical protein
MANGLINLQTDLKSLRYGNDKPYVTKNIGQAPGSQLGIEVQSRIDDTSRIAQMLIDKPGIKYLLHEALLQQVNVADKIKNRGNKTVAGAVLGQLKNTLVGTAKILGSTLAQVPVNGTGLHFLKGFRTDTYLQPTNGNTASGFAQFFGAGGVEGAPLALQGKPIEGEAESNFGTKESPTEFTVTRKSNLDYASKDVSISRNERLNKPIPRDSGQGVTKEYAQQGTVIPIPGSEIETTVAQGQLGRRNEYIGEGNDNPNKFLAESGKPITIPGPQWETTAQRFELGRGNQVGDQEDLKPYEPVAFTNTFASTNTYDNNITPSGSSSRVLLKDTTEVGVEGKPIQISEAITTLGDNGNVVSQNYTSGNTYTGTDTTTNIGIATSGKKIKAHKNPAEYPYFNTPQQDFLTSGGRAGSGIFTKGEESIPKPKRLEKLQVEINTGSAAILRLAEDINVNSTIQDFRQGSTSKYSFDYNAPTINRETRVNLGNQGKVSFNRSNYGNSSDKDTHDTLNSLDIQDNDRAVGTDEGRDFAKFYFEIITPDGSKFLHFRAFIDSIDDSYNADWQGSKYVGRAENFYTYGGFERDISISFKIAAATRSEMKPLYRKMVYLASTTAPTYGGIDSKFMRGTVARITVGSYLSQIPGVITSVKFNLVDGMPWEISMQNPEAGTDDDVQELPMGLQCNISFKAIHDFAPQTGLQHYFTNPKPVNKAQPFF